MQEVLKQADELVGVLQLRISKYEALRNEAAATQRDAEALREANRVQAEALDRRAEAVLARENAVVRIEDVAATEQKVQGDKVALAAAQTAWNQQRGTAQAALDERQGALEARERRLADAELKLDHDKKTYKDELRKLFVAEGWAPPLPK